MYGERIIGWFDAQEPIPVSEYDYRAGVWSALVLFVALTVARLTFNVLTTGKTGPTGHSSIAPQQDKVAEEGWLCLGTTWLVAWSWWAMLTSGTRCGPVNTAECIHSWPALPVTRRITGLFEAEIAWYVHMLTRGWVGVGFHQDIPMAVHHLVTLFLILVGYVKNLMLFGTLMLAVFNTSNPFLHISKVANNLSMARARVLLFAVFGGVFFLTRVAALPATVMKCTLLETLPPLEREPQMWWLYYFGNFLLLGLYAMQLVWMLKIVRVLNRGKSGSTPKVADGKKHPFRLEVVEEKKKKN